MRGTRLGSLQEGVRRGPSPIGTLHLEGAKGRRDERGGTVLSWCTRVTATDFGKSMPAMLLWSVSSGTKIQSRKYGSIAVSLCVCAVLSFTYILSHKIEPWCKNCYAVCKYFPDILRQCNFNFFGFFFLFTINYYLQISVRTECGRKDESFFVAIRCHETTSRMPLRSDY